MMEYRSEEQRCHTHGIDHIQLYYLLTLIRRLWSISTSVKPWNGGINGKCSPAISQALSLFLHSHHNCPHARVCYCVVNIKKISILIRHN
jgi:hypothetical protein